MLDLVVFTQYPLSHAPTRINKEARNAHLKIQVFDYSKIKIVNKLPHSKSVILREPDAKNNIYDLRDEILQYYIKQNSKVLNSNSYLKWSVLDKKIQEIEFGKGNIPHIKSENLKKLKYPFIVKASLGSHGDHVYKITNEKELKNILEKYGKDNLIFQEFQNVGFDLRVIVINFKAVGIMKRTPRRGEFLSNYSQGGKIEKYDGRDKSDIEKISILTAKHFKLDYVGVDLMKGNDGRWKVLEVNRACQFQGFEKATKINVAQRLLNWCILQGIHEKNLSTS